MFILDSRFNPVLIRWEYMFNGVWVPADIEEAEFIQTRVGNGFVTEIVTYRSTHFGPVLTPIASNAAGRDIALRAYPFCSPQKSTQKAFLDASRATKVQGGSNSLLEAFEQWLFPSANVVMADSEGNIAYLAAGAHPVRVPSLMGGSIAQDGNLRAHDWIVWELPPEHRPFTVNPSTGFVHTGNHRPIASWYPLPNLAGPRGDTNRSYRIYDLLSGGSALTPADVRAAHFDMVNPKSRDFTRVIREALSQSAIPLTLTPDQNVLYSYLDAWEQQGAEMRAGMPGSFCARVLTERIPEYANPTPDQLAMNNNWGAGTAELLFWLKSKVAQMDTPGFQLTLASEEIAFIKQSLDNLRGNLTNNANGVSDIYDPADLIDRFSVVWLEDKMDMYDTLDGFNYLQGPGGGVEKRPHNDLRASTTNLIGLANQAYTVVRDFTPGAPVETLHPPGDTEDLSESWSGFELFFWSPPPTFPQDQLLKQLPMNANVLDTFASNGIAQADYTLSY